MPGQDLSMIHLYPYQYNPMSHELATYPDLTVTVTFSGEMQSIAAALKSAFFEDIHLSLAVNAVEILEAERTCRGGPIAARARIVPDTHLSPGEELVVAGIAVLSTHGGAEDAASLRSRTHCDGR